MFLHHQIICLVGIQQETSAAYFREIDRGSNTLLLLKIVQ